MVRSSSIFQEAVSDKEWTTTQRLNAAVCNNGTQQDFVARKLLQMIWGFLPLFGLVHHGKCCTEITFA